VCFELVESWKNYSTLTLYSKPLRGVADCFRITQLGDTEAANDWSFT
jgi:hypothetical protein